jgi:hypothetical protein
LKDGDKAVDKEGVDEDEGRMVLIYSKAGHSEQE